MKINAGEKQTLSQPHNAATTLRNVISRSDSNMPDNFLLFLSETTSPCSPEKMLYSRASEVVTYAQNTLPVHVLLLADVIYFLQFTKTTYLMSSKKTDFCKKSYIFLKNGKKKRKVTIYGLKMAILSEKPLFTIPFIRLNG
jgi:nitrate reductase gamma subunit